mmetsp:Transcript_18976/g.39881  ORF Transcript_18976/g.39881 Transcript_18976/m.39881 type:complete len:212 (+) Transcript_18976:45-680(+)
MHFDLSISSIDTIMVKRRVLHVIPLISNHKRLDSIENILIGHIFHLKILNSRTQNILHSQDISGDISIPVGGFLLADRNDANGNLSIHRSLNGIHHSLHHFHRRQPRLDLQPIRGVGVGSVNLIHRSSSGAHDSASDIVVVGVGTIGRIKVRSIDAGGIPERGFDFISPLVSALTGGAIADQIGVVGERLVGDVGGIAIGQAVLEGGGIGP